MTLYNDWVVEFNPTVSASSPWNEISNLQTLDLVVGRRSLTDDWPVSTGQLRFWYPDGFTTPISGLTVGRRIRVYAPNRSSLDYFWAGFVKNVRVELGIPWSGTKGNADFLVIDVEGALTQWARTNTDVSRAVNYSLDQALTEINDGIGFPLNIQRGFGGYYGSREIQYGTSPGNLNDNALNLLNDTVRSLNGRIYDGVGFPANTSQKGNPVIDIASNSTLSAAGVVFSDTLNDATHRIMESVDLAGVADNYYTKIVVQPVVISAVTSGTGTRELDVNTYNSQTSTATDLATYLDDVLGTPQFGLSAITATASGQHTQNLDNLGATYAYGGITYDCQLGQLCGVQIAATFRGETYSGTIEGVIVSATPEDARFTYLISNLNNSDWLTLDSTYFGVLDEDRLAFT